MKKLLLLLVLITTRVNAQKPLIGFTVDSIKQKNIELGIPLDSWKIDKTGDDFFMLYTFAKSINSQIYYYFKKVNKDRFGKPQKESLNYLFSLITYDTYFFNMIKERTKSNCTYYGNGWYQQRDSGLFVYFKSEIKGYNIYYAMIYSGSPFLIYNYDL